MAGKKTQKPKVKTRKVKSVEVLDAEKLDLSRSLTQSDPLQSYLSEIRKYPLLTPEQEREIALRYYETKDPKAAETLVTSNLRFVVSVAAEYAKFGAKMIDLVQEGNVGLMHAVREFNPHKGNRLITYAVWWIKGYIREYLLKQYSLVKIGTTQAQKKLFYQLQKEVHKLEQAGEVATPQLLSSRLGVTPEEVDEMSQRLKGRDVSLDKPVTEDGDALIIDLKSDESYTQPDDAIGSNEELKILKNKIDQIKPSLNDKELYILENRLLSDEPLTLQEIGDKFKITRERARQLEERILKQLKQLY